VSEAQRALAVAALGILAVLTRLALQAARASASPAERLVEEFRLIRFASLILAATGGAGVGLAAVHEHVMGTALEIMIAAAVITVAAIAATRDPRQALAIIALGFVGHALVDIAHRPGLLPPALAPRWYFIACAIFDSLVAAVCYWPALRR
jgi:hypothetical protein